MICSKAPRTNASFEAPRFATTRSCSLSFVRNRQPLERPYHAGPWRGTAACPMNARSGHADRSHYWFAAKRYGWGWGLPLRWEGWLVYAIVLSLIVAGSFVFFVVPLRVAVGAYVGYCLVIATLLFAICWVKGEPARWRRGDD